MEIWKEIKGYEGLYEVSSNGNVIATNETLKNRIGKNKNKPAFLVKTKTKKGYLKVGLTKNKVKKNIFVHRLVAIAFIDNVEKKDQINHINGQKDNNNISNLEWSTAKENTRHSFDVLGKKVYSGSKNGKKIICTTSGSIFISAIEAAKSIGVSDTAIIKCCKGKLKTVKGLNFNYYE